ncbi:placenta-expressed transcript 1 protein-like [Narcine bancroftii]|uniref:placenta-expressed transcript 1 protein-like n=1 Tax=Narcine bancroftii TaxID=1343680 RepID=UPI0038321CF5
MASIVSVLLLGLFLHGVSSEPRNICKLENSVMGGNFTFTVSPDIYKPNTTYTVTISGFQNNTMVALSAYSKNESVGMWQQNSSDCYGVIGVRNEFASEKWTSPDSIENYVKIRAYINKMGNGSYVMDKILHKGSNMTTPMMNSTYTPTMNSTYTPTMNSTYTPTMNSTYTPTMNSTYTPTMNSTVIPANITANNNMTTPMRNISTVNTFMTTTTGQTTRSTGNVISFKLLHGFTSILLLLMIPELL